MNQDLYDYPPRPRVNPNLNILDLNSVITSELITRLDSCDHNKNWRALINAVPDAPYTLLDVEWFANKKLERKSPAKALLASLGNRGRTVQQLITYLRRIENEAALLLLQTPSEDVYIIQQPMNATVEEGEDSTAVFSCHGKGFPFPRYQWYKACQTESKQVPNGNHRVLQINGVTQQDAGMYTCRLHNDREGKVVSYLFTKYAELKVRLAPEFMMSTLEVTKHPLSVTAQVGNEIVLECAVKSQFTPSFQWYRMKVDGHNLAPVAIQGKTAPTLVFRQVVTDDSGHYKCKIECGREKIWTYFAKVDVVPNTQYNPEPKIPCIIRSPVSLDHVKDNETVVIACEACGKGPLFYQWYLGGEPIQDATGPEYRIEAMKPEYYGEYFCVVYNQNGEAQSKDALIQPSITPPNPIFATDKVALVIGNEAYRNLTKLYTPQNEVEELAVALYCDCNFKVITLIDLTKKEIEFAVSMFCDLLAEGMYGVFFFSGHGFENDGHSFLIPVDCSSEHKINDCVDTQWILDQMQTHKTALNLILLDICRIRNDYQDQKVNEQLQPVVMGNTVFGYAAAANCQAYEASGEKYSVFAKHLLQNIKKRQRIERVLEEVKKGVQEDRNSRGQQFPTIYSDLVDNRGLRDPINSHGQTIKFNARVRQWEEAHEIEFEYPLICKIDLNYYVHIDFRPKTSNIMSILVFIINDDDQRCNVQLQNFPPELDVKVTKDIEQGYEGKVLKTTVSGLQKLKGKLQPNLFIEYVDDWKQLHRWKRMLDLGTPLVSKIWQSRNFKQPTESSYPDYDLLEHQGRGIANSNSVLKEISENPHGVSASPSESKHIQTEPEPEGSVHKEEQLTEDTSKLPSATFKTEAK